MSPVLAHNMHLLQICVILYHLNCYRTLYANDHFMRMITVTKTASNKRSKRANKELKLDLALIIQVNKSSFLTYL